MSFVKCGLSGTLAFMLIRGGIEQIRIGKTDIFPENCLEIACFNPDLEGARVCFESQNWWGWPESDLSPSIHLLASYVLCDPKPVHFEGPDSRIYMQESTVIYQYMYLEMTKVRCKWVIAV